MSSLLYATIPYVVFTVVLNFSIIAFGLLSRRNIIKRLNHHRIFAYAVWFQIFVVFLILSILAGWLFAASKNERVELLDHTMHFSLSMMLIYMTAATFNHRIIVTDSVVWSQGVFGTLKRFELSEFANFTESVSRVGDPVTKLHSKGSIIRILHQWQDSKTALDLVRKNIHSIASKSTPETNS